MSGSGGILICLLVLVCGLAIGLLLTGVLDPDNPMHEAEAERTRRLTEVEIEERQQRQPLNLLFLGGLTVIALGGLAFATVAGVRWLDRRARTIYPDRNGVLPALVMRLGEQVVDLGALAGPARAAETGIDYTALPAEAIPRLQASANTGAAVTRSMRALASRSGSGQGQDEVYTQGMWRLLRQGQQPLPIQVLEGPDVDAHIVRLLDQGNDDRQG